MTDKQKSSQLIPTHDGYRELKSYQMSDISYNATVVFCDRFISKRSRTHDNMVQAARSSKQNYSYGVTTERTASGTCLG